MDVVLLWCDTVLGPQLLGVYASAELAERAGRRQVGRLNVGQFAPIRAGQVRTESVEVEDE